MESHRLWARVWLVCLLSVLLPFLHACGGNDEIPVAYELIESEFIANPENAVDASAIPAAEDTGTHFFVFRDPSEWAIWWARARSRSRLQPLPVVDFSAATVAGVYLGMRTNSCFALNIEGVVHRGTAITVRYREIRPLAGSTCSPVVIYPLRLLRIQATGLPIEFESV